jgi:hypothetical protein
VVSLVLMQIEPEERAFHRASCVNSFVWKE